MREKLFYKKLNQKPYCCVPTCISMVLNRREILHGSQDEIAYSLGLIVPKEDKHLFSKALTGKKPKAGYGTQVQKKQYSINSFFKKNNIKLEEKYFFINEITNPKEFITSNINNDNDIIVCFNSKKAGGLSSGGHVSLIQEIKEDYVFLVDPDKKAKKTRRIKLQKLVEAMKYHGRENRGGFWVISLKKIEKNSK